LPRFEPEILPPDGEDPRPRGGRPGIFVFVDKDGRTHEINMGAPKPFTVILALLIFALISAVILALLFSAILIWIPVAATIILGMIAYAYFRGFWHRLTGR
jgi:glucan phosphoethanolaminetransferase (alkaline phosphatase superfamily)